jgi:hypothetical protein
MFPPHSRQYTYRRLVAVVRKQKVKLTKAPSPDPRPSHGVVALAADLERCLGHAMNMCSYLQLKRRLRDLIHDEVGS